MSDLYQWLKGLDDAGLAHVRAAVNTEIEQRHQARLREQASIDASAPVDDIGRQLAALKAKHLAKKAEQRQEKLDMLHEHYLEMRDKLCNGDVADHFLICAQCGRSIMNLRHEDACVWGKQFVNSIKLPEQYGL